MEQVTPSLQHHWRDSLGEDLKEAQALGDPLCLHVEPPTWIPAEPWKSWNPEVAASRGGLRPGEQSQED